MPAPMVLPAPSPPAPTMTQGSTFTMSKEASRAPEDTYLPYISQIRLPCSGFPHSSGGTQFFSLSLPPQVTWTWIRRLVPPILPSGWHRWGLGFCPSFTRDRG